MSRKSVGVLARGATFVRSVRGSGGRRWWRRVRVLDVTPLSTGFVRIQAFELKTGKVIEWVMSATRKVLAQVPAPITIPDFV